jgi:hypothetical protein
MSLFLVIICFANLFTENKEVQSYGNFGVERLRFRAKRIKNSFWLSGFV